MSLPTYHLIQRKRKAGTVLYAGIVDDNRPGKYSRMLQLETGPAGKGVRDRKRRDTEAHAELQRMADAGLLGASTRLSEYLTRFWDLERSEYLRSLKAEGRTISPAYVGNNRQWIKKYVLPFMEEHRVDTLHDLTKQICRQWRNWMNETSGVSPSTQNKVRQALHVALEDAVRMDLIPFNPMASVRRVKEEPEKRGTFERHELAKLFGAPWDDLRSYAGCMLAASTGLRLGEVRGLLVQNCHVEAGYLDVVTNWQDGQGLKPPKWGDTRYGIPMPTRVTEAVAAVLAIHPYSPGPESFVFFGDRPDEPIGKHVMTRKLKGRCKALSVPVRDFHSLRHTAASLYATAGSGVVQRMLGHSTEAMTLQYQHATDGDRRALQSVQSVVWEPGITAEIRQAIALRYRGSHPLVSAPRLRMAGLATIPATTQKIVVAG